MVRARLSRRQQGGGRIKLSLHLRLHGNSTGYMAGRARGYTEPSAPYRSQTRLSRLQGTPVGAQRKFTAGGNVVSGFLFLSSRSLLLIKPSSPGWLPVWYPVLTSAGQVCLASPPPSPFPLTSLPAAHWSYYSKAYRFYLEPLGLTGKSYTIRLAAGGFYLRPASRQLATSPQPLPTPLSPTPPDSADGGRTCLLNSELTIIGRAGEFYREQLLSGGSEWKLRPGSSS